MTGLSPSSYYYQKQRNISERERRDADLCDLINRIHSELPAYGYRRICHHLKKHCGLIVNHKRVRRLMRLHGLYSKIRKIVRPPGAIATTEPAIPNLLKNRSVTAINQVWVADITYIRLLRGFLYLAAIMDLFSRKIVGWAISETADHQLTCDALRGAIQQRKPQPGILHHSDQGVQYCSRIYLEILRENGFLLSMSRKGNPYDNAFMESFMKTLKVEEVYLYNYETIKDVIKRIPFFLEEIYNKRRLHSSLGYQTPTEFEIFTTKQQELSTLKNLA